MRVLLFILFFIPFFVKSQSFTRMENKSLNAQFKREVYQKWGEFRPYAEDFCIPKIGCVPTNPHYYVIWSFSRRNRNYRNGEDLRPLKSNGSQSNRLLSDIGNERFSDKVKNHSNEVKKDAVKDFNHISSLDFDLNPLYNLYYKKELKSLKNFNKDDFLEELKISLLNNVKYEKYEINNEFADDIIEDMKSNTIITEYINEMEVLQQNYKFCRTLTMPRGKRIMAVHDIFLKHRRMINSFERYLIKYVKRHYLEKKESALNPFKFIKKGEYKDLEDFLNLFN